MALSRCAKRTMPVSRMRSRTGVEDARLTTGMAANSKRPSSTVLRSANLLGSMILPRMTFKLAALLCNRVRLLAGGPVA